MLLPETLCLEGQGSGTAGQFSLVCTADPPLLKSAGFFIYTDTGVDAWSEGVVEVYVHLGVWG